MVFETSSKSRKSWNGRKMGWQCIPNFGATEENDLEVAMEVFLKGTHIDKDEEDRVIAQVHTMEWVQRGRKAVETVAPCSDGSYLKIYCVTNGKPVWLRQNRRDMLKARFLGHNTCKGVLNKLEVGQVGNRCASEERIAIIKSWSNYSRRYCLSCLSGERSNVAWGTDVEIWRFTYFRYLFVKR